MVSKFTHASIQAMQEATTLQQFTGQFLPLEQISRPNLTTAEAAHFLNRKSQTLRCWAMREDGPIRPKRVFGKLAWPTAEVKALAGVAV